MLYEMSLKVKWKLIHFFYQTSELERLLLQLEKDNERLEEEKDTINVSYDILNTCFVLNTCFLTVNYKIYDFKLVSRSRAHVW